MENEAILNAIDHEIAKEQINSDLSQNEDNIMINIPDEGFRIIYSKPLRDYLLDFFFFCLRIIFIIAIAVLIVYVLKLYYEHLLGEIFSGLDMPKGTGYRF